PPQGCSRPQVRDAADLGPVRSSGGHVRSDVLVAGRDGLQRTSSDPARAYPRQGRPRPRDHVPKRLTGQSQTSWATTHRGETSGGRAGRGGVRAQFLHPEAGLNRQARGEGCHAAERAGGKGAGQIGSQTCDGADSQGDQQLTTQPPQPQQAGPQARQSAPAGFPHRANCPARPAQRRTQSGTQSGRGGGGRGGGAGTGGASTSGGMARAVPIRLKNPGEVKISVSVACTAGWTAWAVAAVTAAATDSVRASDRPSRMLSRRSS